MNGNHRSRTSHHKFNIIVVGGGIGGCACAFGLARLGHRVTILEVRDELSELGTGLQISPNSAKILCQWGLRREFEETASEPPWVQYRSYDTGEQLGKHPRNYTGWYEDIYGAPLWTIYRPDCQRLLAEAAIREGAKFLFSAKVVSADPETGTVSLADGRQYTADLIVGADGVWSKIRTAIPATRSITPIVWDEYAYRMVVPRDDMLSNPHTAQLIEDGNTNFFPGRAGILLCYPCSKGKLFNIVAPWNRAPNENPDQRNLPGNPEELREKYAEFASPVPELLSLVEKCVKWTIVYLPLLETYTSENGRVVLIGDAAHAMLPAAASATNAAIEDAAALAECVSVCRSPDDLAQATKAYERVRKPRNDRIWEISLISQRNVSSYTAESYEDAVALRNQRLRQATEELAELVKLEREERKQLQESQVADQTAVYPSPAVLKWLYGHDTIAEAKKCLRDGLSLED